MSTGEYSSTGLTRAELRELNRLAAIAVPASAEYGVPGADDAVIFADIVGSLGRDTNAVREALGLLRDIAGGDFAGLDRATAAAAAMALLGRVMLQCYYRDHRVMRALGREPRPPYPKGHDLEPGDWSLLDAVRSRPPMWRDRDQRGK